MTSRTTVSRRILRGSTALSILATMGVATASLVIPSAAMAQDYTSGAISGTVTDGSGAEVSGAEVTLTSLGQGFTRTSTTSDSGSFRFVSIPTGNYTVEVAIGGQTVYRAENVSVLAGQTADLAIALEGGADVAAGAGNVIVVQGETITTDFEGTTVGLNVNLEELVKTVPLGRDLSNVVLLAPGTTQGDSAFGNLASIGGSSVAENAYYLNGLNLTNFDNYLGSARVPFEFYRSIEVKSGGYPAEFGRATGGIVNAVSKTGSNDFFGAVHLNWSPEWASADGRNLINCSGDECNVTTNRDADEAESYSAIIEAGGPVIRDRLFLYGLVEFRESDSAFVNRNTNLSTRDIQDDPFWAVKVDAYPLDSQHLEFTIFDTSRTTERSIADYSETGGDYSIGSYNPSAKFNFGGLAFVGQYTGTFTDWLTVSAAYGEIEERFDTEGVGSGVSQPFVQNGDNITGDVLGVPFGGIYTDQTLASITSPYDTKRIFYRGDIDLYFNLFGDHHVRAGFDVEENTLAKASVRTGGDFLLANGYITQAAFDASAGGAGIAYILRPGDVAGDTEVELNYFNSGGVFTSENKAFYIQDSWSVTDRLTLDLGLRRDDFLVNRADGEPLVDLDENYAPRIGVTYDLWPDESGKLFGFYGQYFLPIASNTAFRQAGAEFFFRQRYEFEGLDGNNVPILGDLITDDPSYQIACPITLVPGGPSTNCSVTGSGGVPNTLQAFSSTLEATRQTEYILGYEHELNDWTVGISYIHRNLDVSAEDVAVDTAVLAYCDEQGIAGCGDVFSGFHQYVIINPGSDATFQLNAEGLPFDGETITFTAEQLGYPKAERTYDAVELYFRRPFDEVWSLSGSYTWSESRGNSEGFVQSDFGQTDAGITQDFDVPSFTDFAEGLLPNHRRHRFKLFGAFAPMEDFVIGTNIAIESPRPLSCLGYHPTGAIGNFYGQASHYCGLEPAPRGEGLETDWQTQVDLSGRYNVDMGNDRLVTLRVDVFNLFNQHAVTSRDEVGDSEITGSIPNDPNRIDDDVVTSVSANPNYGNATGYQAPRSVRFGLDITF